MCKRAALCGHAEVSHGPASSRTRDDGGATRLLMTTRPIGVGSGPLCSPYMYGDYARGAPRQRVPLLGAAPSFRSRIRTAAR